MCVVWRNDELHEFGSGNFGSVGRFECWFIERQHIFAGEWAILTDLFFFQGVCGRWVEVCHLSITCDLVACKNATFTKGYAVVGGHDRGGCVWFEKVSI